MNLNYFGVFINRLYKILLVLISPLISIFEKVIRKNDNINVQPIFIIGVPRTGSTILYQALTNYSDVSYIDNLTCRWCRNLLFGFWLSKQKFQNKPHNNFKAEYGGTNKYGLHAPSECGSFWYRWLPKDHHFIDHEEIPDKKIEKLKNEIQSVLSFLEKPLLFKNLNAGQRLRLIYKAFPQAKFIYIKRDPRFVIRSILKAREKNKIMPHQWWSIMPEDYKDLLSLPEKEMIAAQVYNLEKQIEEDLMLFSQENIRTIHFQSLSSELINELSQWMQVKVKKNAELPDFRKDKLSNIPEDELKLLTKLVSKYPFSGNQYL